MDELSKRDADALGVDDLTGPQLRWRVFRLEGWLAECMLTLDDIIVGISKGTVPAHVVQRALEITAEVKQHYHDRKPTQAQKEDVCEFCGDKHCTFHNPRCIKHQERIAKAIANGMPPSGRHG